MPENGSRLISRLRCQQWQRRREASSLRNQHNIMKTESTIEPRVIFDNGGGVLIQLPGFTHHYSDAREAAADWHAFKETGSAAGWDGHEPESAEFEPDPDAVQNGGYLIMSADDIEQNDGESGWNNLTAFLSTLRA